MRAITRRRLRRYLRRRRGTVVLAVAVLLGSASAVVFADFPGEMPANTLYGNPTASRHIPLATGLPSCADTGGNHLNWVAGTGFVCGTSGGGGFTGFANPTATIGLTAVNGTATTAMRSDAAPA